MPDTNVNAEVASGAAAANGATSAVAVTASSVAATAVVSAAHTTIRAPIDVSVASATSSAAKPKLDVKPRQIVVRARANPAGIYVPVGSTPAPATHSTIRRAAPTLAAPVLDPSGLPTKTWRPSAISRTPDWGKQRILVGGVDVTQFRNKRTTAERWSFVKPHWYGDATIVIPQLPTYEVLPEWCYEGAAVRIDRELPDGSISTDQRDPWVGYVTTISDHEGGTELVCQGVFQQPDLYRRAPGLRDEPQDVGDWFAFNLDPVHRPAYRWISSLIGPVTGKQSNYRGNWETVLEYLKAFGALIPGWTLRPSANESPLLIDVLASPGETWTYRYARGWITAELSRELRGSPNVIYGEGSVNGIEWRRMVATAAGDAIFIPLSADHAVNSIWMNDAGNMYEDFTGFDPNVLRYEVYWKIPPNISEDDAVVLADAFRTRVSDPGWSGTLSGIEHDPPEGHRLQIRPDDVITLQGHRGGDSNLHVAEASFEWNNGSPIVSLVVDSNARDLAIITAMLGLDGAPPNFEQATNPFYRVQVGKDSGIIKDRTAQWDYKNSGWVPNDDVDGRRQNPPGTQSFAVTGGAWTKKKFLASEKDNISRAEIVVTDTGIYGATGRRFTAIVSAHDVPLPPDVLSPLPVNPLADGAFDSMDPTLYFQQGWGASLRGTDGTYAVSAAGYGNIANKFEAAGDPVTGQMIDETSWPYSHDSVPDDERQPAYLWLYIYTVGANARAWARFVRGPSGG